jgi:tetratricopeptide (TPR) repeat protein
VARAGKALLATHDFARAIEYYESAVSGDGSKLMLRYELAELFKKLKRYDDAERILLDALKAPRQTDEIQTMIEVGTSPRSNPRSPRARAHTDSHTHTYTHTHKHTHTSRRTGTHACKRASAGQPDPASLCSAKADPLRRHTAHATWRAPRQRQLCLTPRAAQDNQIQQLLAKVYQAAGNNEQAIESLLKARALQVRSAKGLGASGANRERRLSATRRHVCGR